MKSGFTICALVALSAPAVAQQAVPIAKPPVGGSAPHGYTSSGSFYLPREGAQYAVPLPPNGTCPFGWTRSGNACLKSGR